MSTNPLARIFGHNPFDALQEHMRAVVRCADEVPPLFEALRDRDHDRIVAIKDRIFEAEEEADTIKNNLRQHLPKSLFLPVDRRDLLDVLDMQDSVADVAQDIAGLLVERNMEIPSSLADALLPFVGRCIDVVHQSAAIVEELDELLEMGFRGRGVDRVEQMVQTLNTMESETDALGIALTQTLFEHEDDMKPISVMFWYRLIEWIGDLADYAEKVGNRLRLLLAR